MWKRISGLGMRYQQYREMLKNVLDVFDIQPRL